MESANAEVEALAGALGLILPADVLHDTRLARDCTAACTTAERAFATSMRGPRLDEFSTTRIMARELLKVLQPLSTTEPVSILPDSDGCVRWPQGFTGSISHTQRICTVALWKQAAVNASVGIDIESLGRLSERARTRIASAAEQDRIHSFCNRFGISASDAFTLLFSAKEAYFKYQFAHTRLWLDFRDVELLDFSDEALLLHAPRLQGHALPSERNAIYRFTPNHVATAVWHRG